MFPFGQLMLPVIGVVAIGLLVIGVKLFFFGEPEAPLIVTVPAANQETTSSVVARPAPESPKTPEPTTTPSNKTTPAATAPIKPAASGQVLAVPVTDTAGSPPAKTPSTTSSVHEKEKETSEPSSGKTTSTTAPLTGSWGVQIGAFSVKSSAEALLSKAQAQGFNGTVSQALIDGKTFYRVQIPSGNSRETALALSERLKKNGYPTLIVGLTP